MASPVGCPVCGADGTAAANEIIARSLPPKPAPAVRMVTAASRGGPHASQLGLVDRNQAEVEARAKVSWGDPPEEVVKFLMIQGFSHQEASDLVRVMFKQRAVATRVNGVRKMVIGFGLVCVPIVAYLIFAHIGVIPIKLMGIAIAVGLWGLWLILNAIIMIVAPKMETGDVAEQ